VSNIVPSHSTIGSDLKLYSPTSILQADDVKQWKMVEGRVRRWHNL